MLKHMLIGIEIGGTKLQLVLAEANGQICDRRKLQVESSHGAEGIRAQIQRTLPELAAGRKIYEIGVGFGGPVDWKQGRICRSHQIEGWSEFDLSTWLQALVRVPVKMDNDANVGALGEARVGAGVGLNPVFYITLGSGVGGGLIVDGQIYHGATPGEAEIGHIRLDRHGTILESRCSGWAVDARIRELTRKEPDSALSQLTANTSVGQARYLPAALQKGDSAAEHILQQLVEDLAFGLSHVVHLFHPNVIILGGGLSGIGEPLPERLRQTLPKFLMEAFAPGPKIVLAALGEDAVPVGALELAKSATA